MTIITTDDPLRTYLSDPAVESAVNLLMKSSSDKRAGLEAGADYFEQAEYVQAWLAAREVYVAWFNVLWTIWHAAWKNWERGGLTKLSSAEVVAKEWELPSLATAWNEGWVGGIFTTKAGVVVGLYAYGDSERVHLSYHAPELVMEVPDWELDDDDFDTAEVAYWKDGTVDLAVFEKPVEALLKTILKH